MPDKSDAQRSGLSAVQYSVTRQPEPLLSKVNAVDVIFSCTALFVQTGLKMISERTISIYSSASIAENPMLCAAYAGLPFFSISLH